MTAGGADGGFVVVPDARRSVAFGEWRDVHRSSTQKVRAATPCQQPFPAAAGGFVPSWHAPLTAY
jgi:hypothetical protein